MKLDTIIYLHELLKADVANKLEIRKAAYDLASKYENDAVVNPDLKSIAVKQREAAKEYFSEYHRALDALEDLEAHDFR